MLYRTGCGYGQTMTFTRPPGTEWRSPRRITRTNGKDAPLRSRTYDHWQMLDPLGERFFFSFLFFFLQDRQGIPFLRFQDFPSQSTRCGIVNNPRVVALLLQTFAHRYSLLTDVCAINKGISLRIRQKSSEDF